MSLHYDRDSRSSPWLTLGLLGGLVGLMLRIGWHRWTHPIVDFGRELYVPWRLSLGDVLYRDVAYFNGPLSPYLNATVFRTFGAAYTVLTLFNIVLLGITLWLLYRLLLQLTDQLTATLGGVLFLVVFALADLTGAGNYNFIAPYSHEMTHGSLLGLAILAVLFGYLRSPSKPTLFATGFLLGLVFLTKAEFFLAAGVAVAAAIFLDRRNGTSPSPGWMIGGLVVGPLIAWLLLVTAISPAEALRGVLGPWPYMFVDELGDLLFYRHGMGTDAPGEHLTRMLVWLGFYAVLFGPPIFAALRTSPQSSSRRWVAVGSAIWTGGLTILVAPRLDMTDLPRPLPVLLAATLVMMVIQLRKRESDEIATDWRSTATIAFTLYALVLLAKMALHPRFHNYGFALAMPATMVLVALLLNWVPAQIDRRGGYGPASRLAAIAFLVLIAAVFTWPSIQVYQQKNLQFGSGADQFKIHERFTVMQTLLEQLPDYIDPNETLLVLPEGVMLNFQLGLRNPTPHINFMPPELIMFGEDEIVAALDASPPDVIVLVKRNTKEYGFETIGSGYGETLMAWVGARYPIVGTIEDPELWAHDYGKALILRRDSR